MTKAEQKRLEKAVMSLSDEHLVDRYMEACVDVAAVGIAASITRGKSREQIEKETASDVIRADILRFELLRRLGGAS